MSEGGTPTLQNETTESTTSIIRQKLRPRRVLPVKRDNMSSMASCCSTDTADEEESFAQKAPKKPKIYIPPKEGSNPRVRRLPRRPIEENDYVYGPNCVYRVVGESVFFNRFQRKHPHVLQLKNVLSEEYDCIHYSIILPDADDK